MSERPVGPGPEPAIRSQPPAPLAGVAGRFAVDVLLACLVLVVSGVLSSLAWTLWQLLQLAAAGALPTGGDAQALTRAIGQPGALARIGTAVAGMSAAALLLYVWRRRADAAERARSRAAAARPSTWAWAALVGLAAFAGSSLAGWLMQRAAVQPVPSNLALVEEAGQRWPLFLVLFAVVLAPAYEELLFRRVFFGRFLAAGWPWLGMLLSSVAFALVHEVPGLSGNPPLAVLQLWLVYGGMGAAFAWVYWRTGTLWAPVAAHAANNGLALWFHGLAWAV